METSQINLGNLSVHNHTRWIEGETVVLRGVWRQNLWFACAVTVVRDTPDLTALYWRAGTPNKLPEKRFEVGDLLSTRGPGLVDSTWTDTDVLMLVPGGAAHSVYAMWEAGHTNFRCWYVNLQEPLRRTSLGFDTMDHLLDIVISPDCSTWRWKDEDQLREAVALGAFSPQQASSIRREGENVIERMRAGRSVFHDGWERWSPPEVWGAPRFPAGWDKME